MTGHPEPQFCLAIPGGQGQPVEFFILSSMADVAAFKTMWGSTLTVLLVAAQTSWGCGMRIQSSENMGYPKGLVCPLVSLHRDVAGFHREVKWMKVSLQFCEVFCSPGPIPTVLGPNHQGTWKQLLSVTCYFFSSWDLELGCGGAWVMTPSWLAHFHGAVVPNHQEPRPLFCTSAQYLSSGFCLHYHLMVQIAARAPHFPNSLKKQKHGEQMSRTKGRHIPARSAPFMNFSRRSYILLLTSCWPELSHMVTPSCKRIQSSVTKKESNKGLLVGD